MRATRPRCYSIDSAHIALAVARSAGDSRLRGTSKMTSKRVTALAAMLSRAEIEECEQLARIGAGR